MMIANSTNMVSTIVFFLFAEKCKILPPGTPWKQTGPNEGARTVILSSNGTTDSMVLSFEFLQWCINGMPALSGRRHAMRGGHVPRVPSPWPRHCFCLHIYLLHFYTSSLVFVKMLSKTQRYCLLCTFNRNYSCM